jgi:ATP-dependent Clp protease ATP-binding subunit ClpA
VLEKKEGAILFIDEIHMIVGAGATSGGSMDASNLLKPALQSGDLRCIGATTHEDFRRHLERDRALVRRFQKLDVHEPSVEDTILILEGLKPYYESFHEVTYTAAALRCAAELSARYINERHLPDKAIDVIDEAGARNRMLTGEQRLQVIDEPHVQEVIAKIARIPDLNAGQDERARLKTLEDRMLGAVYGQDDAIRAVVGAVKLSRAGLSGADKPVGSFLFAGPTGVGKTEVAKQLAAALGVEFLRYDMSEYMEKHTVSRLIGAPPGYVGYDQGGLLTEAVRKNPHSVLLLDEIEKAHPDIFNILLQVMDHATLTDNNGREADFRNVILIMTTNAGAREMSENAIGFDKGLELSRGNKAIERLFSPEFRNRLDEVILFGPLKPEVMAQIVDKFIAALGQQLAEREVTISLTDAARARLAKLGYDEVFGARPLNRLIQQKIRKPLSEELLFGALTGGGHAEVDADPDKDDAFRFTFSAPQA